jgi:hypothetical protein
VKNISLAKPPEIYRWSNYTATICGFLPSEITVIDICLMKSPKLLVLAAGTNSNDPTVITINPNAIPFLYPVILRMEEEEGAKKNKPYKKRGLQRKAAHPS